MKRSFKPTLKPLAALVAAGLLFGCKAGSTAVSQEINEVKPVATNVLTNAAEEAPAPVEPGAEPVIAPPAVSEKVQEVVHLASRGVGDEVLLAFVSNSETPYNLTAEEILYLSDVGISEAVITAMINHTGVSGVVAKKSVIPGTNTVAAVATNAPVAPTGTVTNAAPVVGSPPSVVITATPEFENGAPAPQVTYVVPPVQAENPYYYSSLAPYGSWVDLPDYGWCWQPTVAVVSTDWRPYCDRGRWIYSDCGWYWQSDYSWGWIPFHYGRWHRHPFRGWVWVPGNVWGPAWVTWRYSDAYCGWAPLPPGAFYETGFGLRYNGGAVGISFGFGFTSDYYTFVPVRHFYGRTPWRHTLPKSHAVNIFNKTVVINNYTQNNKSVVNEGISRDRIATLTRSEIRKVTVRDLPAERSRTTTIKPDVLERRGSDLVVYRPTTSRPVASFTNSREQQELGKPAVAAGRTGASAAVGARSDSPQRTPLRPSNLGPAPRGSSSLPQSASAVSSGARSETVGAINSSRRPAANGGTFRNRSAAPPVFRTTPPAQDSEIKPTEASPSRRLSPSLEYRSIRGAVGNSIASTPPSTESPRVPSPATPSKSAAENRSSYRNEPPLIRSSILPDSVRDYPRPIASYPAGTTGPNGSGIAVREQTGTAGVSASFDHNTPQPVSPSSSIPTQFGRGSSRFSPTPQPYQPASSAPEIRSNFRRELPGTFSPGNVERPSFGQRVPSFSTPSSRPAFGSDSVRAPSFQSPPPVAPTPRYSPPSPSVSESSSSRYQSPPARIESHQSAPAAPRPSALSSSSDSSSSRGSSRRNDSR